MAKEVSTPEPLTIEPVSQKDASDCGIACLQMLLGKHYADIRSRVRVKADGVSVDQLRRVAKKLGFRTRWLTNGEFSEMVGIALLRDAIDRSGHFVMVAKGVVIDPASGLIWTDIDAFVRTTGWIPKGLLVRVDQEEEGRKV